MATGIGQQAGNVRITFPTEDIDAVRRPAAFGARPVSDVQVPVTTRPNGWAAALRLRNSDGITLERVPAPLASKEESA